MADTGKQSPLGVNVLGSILNNSGLNINPVAASYMGASKINGSGGSGTPGVGGSGYTFGSLIQSTVLRLLTWSINDAYWRGVATAGINKTVTDSTYNNLITIGTGTIPALGNTRPPTYVPEDPAGIWTTTAVAYGTQKSIASLPGPATSGYPQLGNTDQGQQATWYPWNTSNPNKSVTQWGWVRCHALQAWNEFNWNNETVNASNPEYKEFCSSFLTANAWLTYSNQAIMAVKDSETFLQGVYSNMSDLITADIAGVSQSTKLFGEDLINLGKAINLSNIATFGLPSNLLKTLGLNSAITSDLSLALIAAGLSNSDISNITTGTNVSITKEQEQQIYGAFLLIRGVNLVNVLAPLKCNTQGFQTLADLLNVKKLFPNSYSTLTVPVYNETLGLPTNSKTYYLIYQNGGLNQSIDSPAVRSYVGIQIPAGTPPIFDNTVNPNNYNELPTGFGAYLRNILPLDQAVAAGAFQYSMRQIRNIEYCDFERFAQVVKGMEITTDLPLTAGTNKPTNQASTTFSKTVCALGSGPFGSYTLSDMFGCMSGLPYPWAVLQGQINQLATRKLANIYNQLFLAVTWEKAKMNISQPYYYTTVQAYVAPTVGNNPANPSYQPDPTQPNYDPNPYIGNGGAGSPTTCPTYYSAAGQPAIYDWYYTLVLSQAEDGGGYGRGTAPNPTVTIAPNNVGASVVTSVGRDDNTAASVGGGTFGRVSTTINNGGPYRWLANDVQTNWLNISGQNTDAASPTPPIIPPRDATWVNANMPVETITIQHPPIATLAVTTSGAIATGGTNTSGDVYSRNGLVSSGESGWSGMNTPVQAYITQANTEISAILTSNISGSTQCNITWNLIGSNLKREHRTRYTALIPVPVPKDYFLNTYPMSLYTFVDSVPQLSQDTKPHMSAQTLEAISNTSNVGGQSTIGMMRQERNQTRLQTVGIQLDNNMPSELTPTELKTLTTNGTLPGAVEGITSTNGNDYTPPAWPGNPNPTRPGEVIFPNPIGIYVPPPGGIGGYPPPSLGGTPPGTELPLPVPPIPDGVSPLTPGVYPPGIIPEGSNTGYLSGDGTKPGDFTPFTNGDPNPVVGPTVPVGPFTSTTTRGIITPVGSPVSDPNEVAGGAGIIIIGTPDDLNPNNLPPNLDPNYTSSTLLPSSPSVQDAIDSVIECNCDCWID